MKHLKNLIFGSAVLAMSFSAAVLAEEVEGPWSGKAGFGFLSTDGNSETTSLNADLGVAYKTGRWTHGLTALAISGSTSGFTTAERYFLGLKSDWAINDKSYIFGLIDADKDKFSAYDLRTTETVGYGRKLINTDTRQWNVEIGVGATQLEPIIGEDISDAILRLATDYHWNLSETALFEQTVGIEAGDSNTFLESVTSLKAQVYKDIGIRFSYSIKNNSDVPVGIEKTDTFTAISLEYSF